MLELHASVDTILDGICVIYSLFYCSSSLELERYIAAKLALFQTTGSEIELASVICNLRVTKPDPLAYLINYYYENKDEYAPTRVLRQNISDPSTIPAPLKPLWRSLCAKSPRHIGYYLNVGVAKLGYTTVRDFLLANSSWPKESFMPEFVGEDSCALAGICARLVRQRPFDRTSVFQPIPKGRMSELLEVFRPRSETLAQRLARTRLYQIPSILPPAPYDRLALTSPDINGQIAEAWPVWANCSRLWALRSGGSPSFSVRSEKLRQLFPITPEELRELPVPLSHDQFKVYESPEKFSEAMLDAWLACSVSSLSVK